MKRLNLSIRYDDERELDCRNSFRVQSLMLFKQLKSKVEIYPVWIFCSWEILRNTVLEECFIVLTTQLLIY